ncbi:MAG: hypothetical protein V4664_03415 [Patescibacteria group bacterium]
MSHKNILNIFRQIQNKIYAEKIFENILEQNIESSALKSITLLSHHWNSHNSKTANSNLETSLGVITLLGWVGYTILDHAIDGQHDILKSIPLAERCMRELHWRLSLLCKTPTERTVVIELLTLIETAHYAECHGRVPTPWHKSAGHMIGPLILIVRQDHSPKSAIFKASKSYFIEFLTIKQLSDDLRDWEEDWKADRHTIVTEHLRKIISSLENRNKNKVSFNMIRKIYTLGTLKHFCFILIRRGNIALRALKHTGNHRNITHFEKCITRLQDGARNALTYIKK